MKGHKSTYIIDPSDKKINIGLGDLDTFRYLKDYCNEHYDSFNPKGYEDRYFIFHKNVKRFLPEDKHFALPFDCKALGDLIEKLHEDLQEDKNFPIEKKIRRNTRLL